MYVIHAKSRFKPFPNVAQSKVFYAQKRSFVLLMRWFIFGLILVSFSSLAWAQVLGGEPDFGSAPANTTINSSPTPIGGFLSFYSSCQDGVFMRSVVCDSPSCDASSPSLCSSAFSSSANKSCAAPTTVSDWGYHFLVSSACCNAQNNCTLQQTTDAWLVGVEPYSVSTQMVDISGKDPRGNKLVRRSYSSWVAVFNTSSDAKISTTSDAGATWSSPLSIKSLFSQAQLPLGVSYSNAQVTNPALAMGAASVELVFEIVDTSGKSNVYYSHCVSANCSNAAAWSLAAPILDPIVTETNPGAADSTWQYSLGAPKISITPLSSVHVIFDDSQTNPSLRIQGIFHRFCSLADGCDKTTAWHSSTNGTDILGGVNNDYPRSPHLSISSKGVFAVWVDYSSSGNSSSNSIFVSLYDVPSNTWFSPVAVGSASSFSFPWVSATNARVGISSLAGNVVRVWDCDSSCVSSPTTPTAWSDISSTFSPFNTLTSLSEVALVISPFDASEFVVLAAGNLSGNRQLFGIHSRVGGAATTLRRISNTSTSFSFTGLSDVSGNFLWSGQPFLQWAGATPTGGLVYSSNIFSSNNSLPAVTITAPSTPIAWQSPSSSAYTQSITLTAQDADAEDELYASIYFGTFPNATTHLLRDRVDLKTLQGASGADMCSSGSFTSPRTCTISLPLFHPATGLLAPNGNYYLVAVLTDSKTGSDVFSTPGQVTFSLPTGTLAIAAPASGSLWAGPGTEQLAVDVNNPLFSQLLTLTLSGISPNGSFTFPAYTVSSYGSTISPCVKIGSSYSCSYPILSSSSISEGVYALSVDSSTDGLLGPSASVNNITIDFTGPRLQSAQPQGTLSSPPASISFDVQDFSAIPSSPQVTINGSPLSVQCSFTSNSASCSGTHPSSISSGPVSVQLTTSDVHGNTTNTGFSYTISGTNPPTPPGPGGDSGGGGGGGGGGGPGKVIPKVEDVITRDSEGNVLVNGTPIVIPKTVIETVGTFSNNVVAATSNLVDVVGPSAHAIFLGLCVIAGLASDVVFRRVFSKIRADTYKQRERLVRALLAGIFFIIPLAIGWSFSLVAGFIFTVMEIVGFVAAAYAIKILQYYDTFGYKTIQGVASAISLPPRPPLM